MKNQASWDFSSVHSGGSGAGLGIGRTGSGSGSLRLDTSSQPTSPSGAAHTTIDPFRGFTGSIAAPISPGGSMRSSRIISIDGEHAIVAPDSAGAEQFETSSLVERLRKQQSGASILESASAGGMSPANSRFSFRRERSVDSSGMRHRKSVSFDFDDAALSTSGILAGAAAGSGSSPSAATATSPVVSSGPPVSGSMRMRMEERPALEAIGEAAGRTPMMNPLQHAEEVVPLQLERSRSNEGTAPTALAAAAAEKPAEAAEKPAEARLPSELADGGANEARAPSAAWSEATAVGPSRPSSSPDTTQLRSVSGSSAFSSSTAVAPLDARMQGLKVGEPDAAARSEAAPSDAQFASVGAPSMQKQQFSLSKLFKKNKT